MSAAKVLVAYGSKHGATAGIAYAVGDALRGGGLEADVRDAAEVESIDGYDAVVLGGAIYAAHWVKPARRFAKRFGDELSRRPVWLFSSGPLDDSADREDLPMIPGVAKIADRVGAREHKTFGGELGPEDDGWIASAMVRDGKGGDFRNWDAIATWGEQIATALAGADAAR